MTDSLTPLITDLASILANGIWQALLIAFAVAIFLRFRSNRTQLNATTTYAVVLAAFWLAVGIQVVAISNLQLLPSPVSSASEQLIEPATIRTDTPFVAQSPQEFQNGEQVTTTSTISTSATLASVGSPSNTVANSQRKIPVLLSRTLAPVLPFMVGSWIVVSVLLLLRLAGAIHAVLRIRNAAHRIPEYELRVAAWQNRKLFSRQVSVASHPDVTIPFVVGLGRPTILIPSNFEFDLDDSQIDQVLLHELAHINRHDDWTLLFQRAAEAVFFFNPAVKWLGKQLISHREMACDESVVARTRRPDSYVSSLGRIAEMQLCRQATLAVAGMAVKQNSLLQRVKKLLDNPSTITDRFGKEEFAIACGILALLVVTISYALPSISITIGDDDDNGTFEYARIAATPALPPIPPIPPLPAIPSIPDIPNIPDVPDFPDVPSLPDIPDIPAFAPVPPSASTYNVRASAVRPGPVSSPPLSNASWIKLLDATQGISSSGDRARVLTEAASRLPDSRDVYIAYFDAASTLESMGDTKRVVVALTSRADVSNLPWENLLSTVGDIRSDSDKAAALQSIAPYLPDNSSVRSSYIDAASSIRSTSLRERTLSAGSTSK